MNRLYFVTIRPGPEGFTPTANPDFYTVCENVKQLVEMFPGYDIESIEEKADCADLTLNFGREK